LALRLFGSLPATYLSTLSSLHLRQAKMPTPTAVTTSTVASSSTCHSLWALDNAVNRSKTSSLADIIKAAMAARTIRSNSFFALLWLLLDRFCFIFYNCSECSTVKDLASLTPTGVRRSASAEWVT